MAVIPDPDASLFIAERPESLPARMLIYQKTKKEVKK